MDGLLIAAALITLVQFWRRPDRRLVPLALMFAFLAGAEAREPWEPWRRRFQLGALASGLALLALFSIEDDAASRRDRRP